MAAPLFGHLTVLDGEGREVVRMDSYVVSDFREKGYVATASTVGKISASLTETPQSITIITADLIRDQNAQTMQEVLRYAAGVRSEMYGLDNRGDWFTLRGGSEGSTLLDGLRLPLTGWWGVVRNEPYAFDRVEVLRGPASVAAGQNGPGGVVNLVSKRPLPTAHGEIAVQFGNHQHKQVAADLTGPLGTSQALLYRVVALVRDSDTQVDHAFDEREFFASSLAWRLSDATTLTVFAECQRDESGNTEGFFPWEGTLYRAPNGYIPMNTFVGEPAWDTYGGERLRLGYHFEHRLDDRWTLRHNLRHDRVDGELATMYAAWWEGFVDADGNPHPNGRHLNRVWYANDDVGRITNADLLAEGRLALGRTEHALVVGIDGMDARNEQKSLDGAATPLDVYTPTYGTFPKPVLDYGPAVETRTRQFGVLAQDRMKFGEHWVATAGIRHDRVKTTVDGSTAQGNDDAEWSTSAGLVYLAPGGWSPYVSYAESFEAVAGTDAANAAFDPRRGEQIEAGVKWSPGKRFVASAAAYRLKESGRLTDDPINIGYSVQRGEVTVEGFELEATATLGAWSLLGNYTYAEAAQTASSDPADPHLGKRLHSIPEHSAALWAMHAFQLEALRGLRLGAGVRYVGETWDGTDTVRTPSNTLVDALVSYDRGPWRYALNVSNLLDKSYVATALERGDTWFGPRRKLVATVTYHW
jgi:iron complex outermembrane recepter protein